MRPTVSAFTERVYAQLPALYIDNDAALDFPLLRYLSLLGDQAGEVADLYSRIDYVTPGDGGTPGDTSDLADPATADVSWLAWLGQLVGADIPAGLTTQEKRDAVTYAPAGYRAATTDAVRNAARTALTGTKYVSVYRRSVTSPGDGGVWDVLLVTRASETPDVSAVLFAIVAKKAKPAGVVLHHRAYTAPWSAVHTAFPTWADRNGLTWAQIQEAGL